MDTNAKTLQINTFAKGMDTDTSDALINNESYRVANNLRYITDTDSNSGELRLIEGAKQLDFIKNPGLDFEIEGHSVYATTTIRNYGIIITTSSIETDDENIEDDTPTPSISRDYKYYKFIINVNGLIKEWVDDHYIYRIQPTISVVLYTTDKDGNKKDSGVQGFTYSQDRDLFETSYLCHYSDGTTSTEKIGVFGTVDKIQVDDKWFTGIEIQVKIKDGVTKSEFITGFEYDASNVDLTIMDEDGNRIDPEDETTEEVSASDITFGWRVVKGVIPGKEDGEHVALLLICIQKGILDVLAYFGLHKTSINTYSKIVFDYANTQKEFDLYGEGLYGLFTYSIYLGDSELDTDSMYYPGENPYVLYHTTDYNCTLKKFPDLTNSQYIINSYSALFDHTKVEYENGVVRENSPRRKAPVRSTIWNVFRYDNNTNEITKILECRKPIGNYFKNKLSLVSRWEDDDNVKLYIADGELLILTINVMDYYGVLNSLTKITNSSVLFVDPIEDVEKINGSLKPALVQYAYRLYNKHSVSTQLSPLSKLYVVNSTKGLLQNETSNIGYKLTIPYTEEFSRIEIYRISYMQVGLTPTIELIIDSDYSESDRTYSDVGQSALLNLSLEEFNGLSGVKFKAREIESKDGYLFAANIDYSASEYIQNLEDWQKNAIGMTDDMKNNLNLEQDYLFNAWGFGFDDSSSNINWEYIYDELIISILEDDEIYNDSNLRSDNRKSLRRDEIYRYGIIWYSDDGFVSSPIWLADIRTPSLSYSVVLIIGQADNTAKRLLHIASPIINYRKDNSDLWKLIANNLGIRFTVNNKPEGWSHYEIVRCNRSVSDRATITLVALSTTFNDANTDLPTTMPTGLVTVDDILFSVKDGTVVGDYRTITNSVGLGNNKYAILIISPEISYQSDDISQLFDSTKNLYLTPVYPLYPDKTIFKTDENYSYVSVGKHLTNSSYYLLLQSTYYTTANVYGGPYEQADAAARSYFEANLFRSNGTYNHRSLSYYKLFNFGNIIDGDLSIFGIVPVSSLLNLPLNEQWFKRYSIKEYKFPKVAQWNQFASDLGDLQYTNDIISIGLINYINWSFPAALITYNSERESYIKTALRDYETSIFRNTNINIGGRCGVITSDITDDDDMFGTSGLLVVYNNRDNARVMAAHNDVQGPGYEGNANSIFSTIICNIRKHVVPYGGLQSKNNSIYYSHGYYTDDETIDVYDGDTFIRCLEYSATHDWENAYYEYHTGETVVCSIPFETDIDIPNDSGDRYSRVINGRYIQDQPANVMNKYIQERPEYQYNTAYGMESSVKSYSSSDDYYESLKDKYDYRVHYSNLKDNNEYIDQWTIFQPLNYLDVDTRYGSINELRRFRNSLMYWQNNAVGILSVNERTQISDDSGLPLILGTGGVLARYDYLSTRNGMKENQFADTQSDTTLYWWDYDRHEICAYTDGLAVIPLSKVKSVLNFLNQRSNELLDNPNLLYDKKYNEVLFNVTELDNSETLVYNESMLYFSAIYSIDPTYHMEFTNRILMSRERLDLFKEWNKSVSDRSYGLDDDELYPSLKYIINDNLLYTKVFDTVEFAGTMYNGGYWEYLDETTGILTENGHAPIRFEFDTSLKLHGELTSERITNRQYEFKFSIPRSGKLKTEGLKKKWVESEYGDRLRGKTMQCEMSSDDNSLDFSLQYILTKYRISWS